MNSNSNYLIRGANYFRTPASMMLSGIFRKSVLLGKPWVVMIEPTSLCNLKCVLCPTGMGSLNRKKGSMTIERMRELIQKLPGEVSKILFWGMGEPFLAESFFAGVEEAKKRGIASRVSTNGHFLGENGTAGRLLDVGLDELVVSLDGTTSGTYETYRRGGNFNRVVEGIRAVCAERDKRGSKKPAIIQQFLVTAHNEHELTGLGDFSRSIGCDRVVVKTLQAGFTPEGKKHLPENKKRIRYYESSGGVLEPVKRRRNWGVPCRRLWYSTVITWRGDVLPCCFDRDSGYTMGNLFEESFESIWHGARYSDFRQTILSKGSVFPMCGDCTEGLRRLYVK